MSFAACQTLAHTATCTAAVSVISLKAIAVIAKHSKTDCMTAYIIVDN